MKNPDLSNVVPIERMKGEDLKETTQLRGMLAEAKQYLLSFRWCGGINESYFGLGVGGIVAVFLFKIQPNEENVDAYLWVIVGDLPPAYISSEYASAPADALNSYVGEMEAWVAAAKAGNPVDDLIPVNVPPTVENARLLEARLELLTKTLLSDELLERKKSRKKKEKA